MLGSAEGGQAEAGDANGEGEGEGDMDVDHDKGGNGSPGANADPEEKGAGAHLRGGHLEGLFEFVEGYEEAARTVQPSLWVSGREREAWLQDLATAQVRGSGGPVGDEFGASCGAVLGCDLNSRPRPSSAADVRESGVLRSVPGVRC